VKTLTAGHLKGYLACDASESTIEASCEEPQRPIGRASTTTKVQLWRLIATVPCLAVFFPGAAACQEVRGTPVGAESTRFDYSKSHSFSRIVSPYTVPFLPAPQLDNSRRLQNLIVDGELRLTLDDAIALALENNLEIAVTRYDLPIAQTDLLRAEGAARPAAWRAPINPPPCFPAVSAEVWAAPEALARVAREVFWEAVSTALAHRPAAIQACMSAMAGAMPLPPELHSGERRTD